MSLKRLFFILFFLNTVVSLFLVFVIREYKFSTKKLEQAYEMRYKSLILADELRQSSDDLTRLARTYVLTGDPLFEQQYKLILEIRNGQKPRPYKYNGIFWDFYTTKEKTPKFDGQQIALKDLMRQANFPEEELAWLFTSQNESDDLTNLEKKAMNAIKGLFQDKNGSYTIYKQPDFKLARELMHSEEYHNAKIRIMKPLDDFYKAFEERTQFKVNEAHNDVKKLESFVNMVILISITLFVMSFGIILSHIIFPLDALKDIMSKLSKNDMSVKIKKRVKNNEIDEMLHAVEIFKENTFKLITGENQLKIAIENANNANKAKSIFLAKMSHELRTPLNSILGFASLLMKSVNMSQNEKNNLQIIKKSGEHLLAIINEILELSKIEAGKISITNKEFNFYELLDELRSLFEYRCKSKGLKLTFEIDEHIPMYIICDEKRLKQICINLLNNSLKFTNFGEIKLRAYAKHHYVYFDVIDTGIGIKEDDFHKIFNPFEQLKQNNNQIENGTGLGLSISKELIHLMKGKIFFRSQVDIGTTFSFYVKFFPSVLSKQNKKQVNKNLELVNNNCKNELKFGILDDNFDNRALLSQYLSLYQIHTFEFEDEYEAMNNFKKEQFDMIFVDLSMPKIDGFEFVTLLKKYFFEFKYKTKIVIFSANVFDDDKEKAFASGADYFLNKPFDEIDLLKIINLAFEMDLKIIDIDKEDESSNISMDGVQIDQDVADKIYDAALKMDAEMIKNLSKLIDDSNTKKIIEKFAEEFNFKMITNLLKNNQ